MTGIHEAHAYAIQLSGLIRALDEVQNINARDAVTCAAGSVVAKLRDTLEDMADEDNGGYS